MYLFNFHKITFIKNKITIFNISFYYDKRLYHLINIKLNILKKNVLKLFVQ